MKISAAKLAAAAEIPRQHRLTFSYSCRPYCRNILSFPARGGQLLHFPEHKARRFHILPSCHCWPAVSYAQDVSLSPPAALRTCR